LVQFDAGQYDLALLYTEKTRSISWPGRRRASAQKNGLRFWIGDAAADRLSGFQVEASQALARNYARRQD
jgi:hypothetical protein